MRRIVSLALASLIVFQSAAFAAPPIVQDVAQEEAVPLTNKDVATMVKAKVPPDVIVAKIESSRCHFDTAPSVLAELRHSGTPNEVLMAMVKAPYGRPRVKPEPRKGVARDVDVAEEEPSDAGETSTLPEGTALTVTPTEEINSKHATEGQVVTFRVVEDVEDGGLVFIKAGALVRGTVTNVEGRGMLGKAGKLSVSIDSVRAVDGQKVRLRAVKGKEGGSNTGKVIALSLLVTPLFLLMRGNTARIKPGQQIQVFTDEGKEILVRAAPAPPAVGEAEADTEADAGATTVTPSASGTSRSPRATPGTDVRVRGYYRKDGTYVRPHTRSAPRRRN